MKFKIPHAFKRRTDGDANTDRTETNDESNRENRGSIEKPFKVLDEATISRPLAEPLPPPPPPLPPVAKETRPLTFVEKLKIFGRNRKVSCRLLLVLMWKHGVVRLKRFIVTPLEFIIPGLFFLFLLLLANIFIKYGIYEDNKLMAETAKPLHHLGNPCLVLYTPENDFTRSLMNKAGHQMNLEPLMFFPNSTSKGYFGFSNYFKPIVNLINELNSESALVIFNFQDRNSDVPFPDKLYYTIRIRGNHTWNEMGNHHPQPRNLPQWLLITQLEEHETSSPNMVPELYMRIQWAIDTSFIQLRVENEMKLKERSETEQKKPKTQMPVVFVSQYLHDKKKEDAVTLMVVLTQFIAFISLILPFAILTATLMSERYSGIQELMKQAGVTYNVWACSHSLNTVVTGLFFAILGTVVLYFSATEYLNYNTNFFFTLLALWLYFHSIMSFAFPLSFIAISGNILTLHLIPYLYENVRQKIDRPVISVGDYAALIAFVFYILMAVPSMFLVGMVKHTMLHLMIGLLPHVPFIWFCYEFIKLESKSGSIGFHNFYRSHSPETMSALLAYIYMIIQIILNMLLAAYLSNVAPGKYGVRKPLNYLSERKGVMPYISTNSVSAGPAVLILLVQFIVYSIILMLTQYGIFNGLKDRIFNAKYVPLPKRFSNQHVKAEEQYVEEQLRDAQELKSNEGRDALLVYDLHKKYPKLCNSINAVRGIDFSVKKGECFGLLGVNGAGKSSTFKMIVAEEVATRGTIFANGHFLTWPRSSKYMQSLGYCPQFSGLDEFMTGKQNLNLVLVLRGLSDKDVNTETEAWIQVVGLEKYRNILVGNYSGGCKRRLATACSLSSGGAVTLLDEPTAGVDVSARRRVWVALKKGLRSDRSVIITSHSMDEMEALCNRIAIMAAGEIGAFGSVPQLRAEHASGHALNIKTSHGGQVKGEDIQKLKDAIQQTFGCSLKDEHGSMLHYHIIQTMHYSELFTKLEALKQDHPVMEDYSITETTLEEVFLSFAKPQQKDNKNRRIRGKGPGTRNVANRNRT